MLVALVHVHVKTEDIAAFIEATIENARNSVLEPGIARFDFIQQSDDPARFVLIEVFRDADAPNKHRETAHYLKWRDTVADMLAEPRVGIRHINVFPDDGKWG
ncbi:MAG: antibiotic biosynthesis monooxygenase [Anaerolineae bacterium]|nr:antibiotic biosynthesis monooxygenase [Anaerolineae bacterium]